ncbi:protein-export chaperone SecB [Candidatus Parabeggiatoa sp. HSG14]|uniref:protein-export chaperone SecB n=1 Tax=Candidatus Parabeggiatoa sp. HSG14 TaxID=3055593 RepID=UPI0025A8D2F9|nr:protein-export chaperone SecB [Thiotrichales bacterium HSG14]
MEEQPKKADDGTTPEQFGVQNVYIKDISFETPNSPQIFMESWKPQLEMEISNDINTLQDDIYEVVLNLTVTVKVGEKTAFLVEVHQAGIFALKGFAKEKLSYMLNSYCPNILFPYIRETISSLVTRGGFQPFFLAPVNFDALYNQRLQQQKQEKEGEKITIN